MWSVCKRVCVCAHACIEGVAWSDLYSWQVTLPPAEDNRLQVEKLKEQAC